MTGRGNQVGALLRKWREDRGISQLALASRAEVSTRHLSFVENGRSAPSRGMILRLAEHLDVPLRERNQLLLAAGFAPGYAETALDAPRLAMVSAAIRTVLAGHAPYPALVVDRGWDLVDANESVALLTDGAPPELLEPPFNVLRFALHPRGMAGRIANLGQWRRHLLDRLERQLRTTGDTRLGLLHRELLGYPEDNELRESGEFAEAAGDVMVPLILHHDGRRLAFFSMVTTFGTPTDITVDELSIESFFPADEQTAKYLRGL